MVVPKRLNGFANEFELKVAAVAMFDQGGHERAQPYRAVPWWESFPVGRWQPLAIGHLHDGRQRHQVGQESGQRRVIAKLPQIERNPHCRMVESLHPANGMGEIVQEITAGCGGRMHGLEGQRHAPRQGFRGEHVERVGQQPVGMTAGVAAAAATVDDQYVGVEFGRRGDRFETVVDAVVKRPPIAPREAPGPLQARNPQASLADQALGLLKAHIGEFRPPDRQAFEAMAGQMFDFVGEFPAEHRQFTDGRLQHARDISCERESRSPRGEQPALKEGQYVAMLRGLSR